MDDLAEFESWHEDFMAWESFQDELERIKGEIPRYGRRIPFQNPGAVPQPEHAHVKETDIKTRSPSRNDRDFSTSFL